MSKPKHAQTDKYTALVAASQEVGEHHDCAVKAVCVVTGADYHVVRALFEKHGRKPCDGAHFVTAANVLADLGFKIRRWSSAEKIAMLQSYPNYHVSTITLRQPSLFPELWADKGTLLLRSNGHITAFADGVIHDHMVKLRSHVHDVIEVLPI